MRSFFKKITEVPIALYSFIFVQNSTLNDDILSLFITTK